MPLKGFVRPGAAIDEHDHSSGKNDVKALHWVILGTQHVARIQPERGFVGYQPLELRPGRCSEGSMFSQPIDQVLCYHRRDLIHSISLDSNAAMPPTAKKYSRLLRLINVANR